MSAVLMPPAGARATTPWRQALPALGAAVVALLLLYRETMAAMVGIWLRSDTFAHAILVPPITLWLAWRLRHRLAAVAPRPQPWWLAALALAALGWLVGDLAGANALTQLMLTALLVLAVPAVLGLAAARVLAFPLAFLFFMVPIGEFLLPLMMERTADFTVWALRLSGVPVYREGLLFVIPSGNWSVVEACSGVRYLIASFMVGTLFAYLNYRSTTRRLVFCAVSIVVPVIANWLRAYMIVMLGHLSGNTIAVGADHLIYGWVFFGVVIGLMFFIGSRWSEPDDGRGGPAAQPASPQAGVVLAEAVARPWAHWAAAAAVVAVAAVPQLAQWRFAHEAAPVPALALPELPGWTAGAEPPVFEPAFAGAAAQAARVYRAGAGSPAVTVHVAYYRQQSYGRKLVGSGNTLVASNDKHWRRAASGRQAIEVDGHPVEFRSAVLLSYPAPGQAASRRLELRQLLWAGDRFTASDPVAVLRAVAGRLTGQGDDAAALTIYAEGDDPAAAAEAVDAFIRDHLAAFQASLRAASEQR